MTALPDWMVRSGEGLTVADYEALPEEVSRQVEILDGTVTVSPSLSRENQRVARRLANAVEAAVPAGFAVETDDRMDKPTECAASGIPHFWRVEIDDSTISVFRYQLDAKTRTYRQNGVDTTKLVIDDPVELELDLETLR